MKLSSRVRLSRLRERALAEGIDEQALEDALDSNNPKETLIALLMKHVLAGDPAERMATALQGTGKVCAALLSSVFDHAMNVLEELSLSSPRKNRKGLRRRSIVWSRGRRTLSGVRMSRCSGTS